MKPHEKVSEKNVTETVGDRLTKFLNEVIPDTKHYKKELGQDANSIYNYKTNRRNPGAVLIVRLINKRCNINWLFTGIGSMYIDSKARQAEQKKKVTRLIEFLEKSVTEAKELQKELL